MTMNRPAISIAVAFAFGVIAQTANATDVVIQPSAGSGFVVKDAGGANERLRVQETGAISLPAVPAAPAQSQGLCMSAGGQLGPCSGSGASYTAATGLALTGTTFSVAPTYRLPQGCAANQVAQWNGTAWACGSASSAALPVGTVNQTLRYDASNALVANNLLQAFADGGLVAGATPGIGSIPATGVGTRLMWYSARGAFRVGEVIGTQWDDSNVGIDSVAMGFSAVASGQTSTAMGVGTTASGGGSTAMGVGTTASADFSTAMGNTTHAIGFNSIAMGSNTYAKRQNSTAMGYDTFAEGDISTAMGAHSHANGTVSIAMGSGAKAIGEFSIAMGTDTEASKDFSTAIGLNTLAGGQSSTAMGAYTHATGAVSTAMGSNTQATGHASTAMGSGTLAGGDSSTAMGNNAQAAGSSAIAAGSSVFADADNSIAMGSKVGSGGKKGSFIFGDASRTTGIVNDKDNQFKVVADGGIVLTLSADGSNNATLNHGDSAWNITSDRNTKTALLPVDPREVLKKVVEIPLNTWRYKTQDADYRHMGPMAQDFYAAFHLGPSDKSISTVDADGVALAAIQGLNVLLAEKDAKTAARLDEKDREIAALREEIASQAKNKDAQIAALRMEKNREVAQLRADLAARVAAVESLVGDLSELKAQLRSVKQPVSAVATVALKP